VSDSRSNVPAVEAVGLVKRYDELLAVDDLTLSVAQGDVYGVLGPNGAGKTTFLRMLFGLIRPDQGVVKLFGQSVEENAVVALAGVGGFIETPRFYTYMSGRKNLKLLARLDLDRHAAKRIDEMLELVDLGGRGDDKVGTYSYGMRQRLGVAASLLRDPRLLVVDEPTNGLDPAGMRDMRALIKRLADTGLTVLLSSHHMLEVEEICQHVTIMGTGKVVFHGSLDDLRALAPETEYALSTPDPHRAVALCADVRGVREVRAEGTIIHLLATEHAIEELSVALGMAGIPIRSLAPARAPLESLFFRLTGSDAHLHFASKDDA
jgi:ABC-2 type transport system ATP-binding protein